MITLKKTAIEKLNSLINDLIQSEKSNDLELVISQLIPMVQNVQLVENERTRNFLISMLTTQLNHVKSNSLSNFKLEIENTIQMILYVQFCIGGVEFLSKK